MVVDAVCMSGASDNIMEIEDRIMMYLRANNSATTLSMLQNGRKSM